MPANKMQWEHESRVRHSRRQFLKSAAALAVTGPAFATVGQNALHDAGGPILAYVGTYSSPQGPEGSNGNARGIYLFEMDRATGALSQREVLSRLARIAEDQLTIAPAVDANTQATTLVVADATVYLTGLVDVAAERTRLARELEEAEAQAERTRAQLANDNFVSRAKPDVVQGARDRLVAAEERIARLRERLDLLGAA